MSWGELFKPEVFDRGAQVYFDGKVTDLEVFSDHINAKVEDNEVMITKVKGEVAQGECTCQRPWCEHIAAVLFASEDEDRWKEERSLESILEDVPPERLREFILALSDNPAVEEEARKWFDPDYDTAITYEEDIEDILNDLPLVGDLQDEDLTGLEENLTEYFLQKLPGYVGDALYDDLSDLLVVIASNLDAYNSSGRLIGLFRSLFQMAVDACKGKGEASLCAFAISLIRTTRYDSLFSFEEVIDNFFLSHDRDIVPADYLLAYYGRRKEETSEEMAERFVKAEEEVIASLS